MLGTALVESGLRWLRQRPTGPARGLWQIEPFTARDVLGRYLKRRNDLATRVRATVYPLLGGARIKRLDDAALGFALANNLALGCAICRLIYLWTPEPIPKTLNDQAIYWLTFFNKGGHGTIEHYIKAWKNQ